MKLPLLVLALAAHLAGCESMPLRMPTLPESADVTITGLRAVDYALMGVDIDNRAGSVKVTVDPSLDAPRISAIIADSRGVRTRAPWAAADLDTSGPRPVLRVLAAPPAGQAEAYTEIVVRVPACGGVRVHNRRGPVLLTRVAGAIDAQNGTETEPGGSVTVSLGKPAEDPILIRAGGPILLDMPAASRGRVHARALAGGVTVTTGRARVTHSSSRPDLWTGTLNGGDQDVRLESTRGDVTMRLR